MQVLEKNQTIDENVNCQRKQALMDISLQKVCAQEILPHCKKYPHTDKTYSRYVSLSSV